MIDWDMALQEFDKFVAEGDLASGRYTCPEFIFIAIKNIISRQLKEQEHLMTMFKKEILKGMTERKAND